MAPKAPKIIFLSWKAYDYLKEMEDGRRIAEYLTFISTARSSNGQFPYGTLGLEIDLDGFHDLHPDERVLILRAITHTEEDELAREPSLTYEPWGIFVFSQVIHPYSGTILLKFLSSTSIPTFQDGDFGECFRFLDLQKDRIFPRFF